MSPRNIPPPPLTKPPPSLSPQKVAFISILKKTSLRLIVADNMVGIEKDSIPYHPRLPPKKFHSDPKLYRILISALAINHKLQTQCGEEDVPTKVVVAMKWGYKQNPNQVNDGNQKELFVQGTEMKHHKNALLWGLEGKRFNSFHCVCYDLPKNQSIVLCGQQQQLPTLFFSPQERHSKKVYTLPKQQNPLLFWQERTLKYLKQKSTQCL